MPSVVFRRVRVFDGERRLPVCSVVVTDGVITTIGSDEPAGAEIVDGEGRMTLLPGLIDAHFHLLGEDSLRQAITFGTTTVLSMGDDPAEVARLRSSGEPIADIRSAGVSAKAPGSRGTTAAGAAVPFVTGPEDAERFVAARIADGSDYIKIRYDDGDLLSAAAGHTLPFVSKETMAAIVAESHRRGLKTMVHIGTLQAAHDALDAGVDGLAHVFVDRVPDASIALRAKELGTFVVPTLNVFELISGGSAWRSGLAADSRIAPYLRPEDLAVAEYDGHAGCLPVDTEAAAAAVRAFREAGVPLLAGSDPTMYLHGVALWRELELLVQAGLSGVEALAAATSVPADAFGLVDRGRIAAGLRADLMLVDGDPTADVSCLVDLVGVWKGGERIERRRPSVESIEVVGTAFAAGRGSGFLAETVRGDFVLVAPDGPALVHYERLNDQWGYPWRRVGALPFEAVGGAVAVIPGAVEVVARSADGLLLTYRLGAGDAVTIGDATGDPAVHGSNMLVPCGEALAHYRRLAVGWRKAAELPISAAGVALSGDELAVRTNAGELAFGRLDGSLTLIGSADGDPTLVGDDLVVPYDGRLVHYHREAGEWRQAGLLPGGRGRPVSVAMIASTFGNLELVARTADGVLLPYYRDRDKASWAGLPVLADGSRVFGDLGIWEAVARKRFDQQQASRSAAPDAAEKVAQH
ncbi:amidohydrolase family protein [Kutzneria buriramensis]|uniref:Imidazolonepropionase-like amidohydrolase n=1 Tax=Kutzneria buriramensis TaxID=1045776 RepID=A0A3E0HER3_9PSEU|nr:amidohydrolase family protein [Kutzneria buriramensis]REH43761.1 imidazolonepropionase-like amidohydrolase [Kutzneria buriramensis]